MIVLVVLPKTLEYIMVSIFLNAPMDSVRQLMVIFGSGYKKKS